VTIPGGIVTVNLENVSRDYERDHDPGRVIRFVDSLASIPALPSWEEARPRIRWQAEAASHDFGDTFHDKVSDMVALALVYVDPAETQIMWLSPALAEHWGKTHEELWAAAVENMKQLLGQTTVSLQTPDAP